MDSAEKKKRIKPVIEEVLEEPEVAPVKEEVSAPVETPPAENPVVEEAPLAAEAEVKDPSKKMNLKLIIVITLISALVAAFVSGGVYVYLSGVESLDNETQPSPTPATSATPAPTATPEAQAEDVDITAYSVEVLNGSGKIGAASAVEEVLTEAKFTVEKTGNAGRYDYKNTVISAKSSVPLSVVSQMKKALEEADYEVEVGDKLEDTAGNDIVVTVGAN